MEKKEKIILTGDRPQGSFMWAIMWAPYAAGWSFRIPASMTKFSS